MKTVKEITNEIVKIGLAPMFKENGFKKSGFHFARRRGTVAHYFGIQLSQWNQGASGHFYLNAGVMFDDFRRHYGKKIPELPKYADCDFMVRFEQIDLELARWVTIDENIDVQERGKWLREHVENMFVVPLNSVSTTAAFETTGWADKIPWGFPAVFQYFLGNTAEARRLIQREADYFADRGSTFESVANSLRLVF
jgi:hypothetical protein